MAGWHEIRDEMIEMLLGCIEGPARGSNEEALACAKILVEITKIDPEVNKIDVFNRVKKAIDIEPYRIAPKFQEYIEDIKKEIEEYIH